MQSMPVDCTGATPVTVPEDRPGSKDNYVEGSVVYMPRQVVRDGVTLTEPVLRTVRAIGNDAMIFDDGGHALKDRGWWMNVYSTSFDDVVRCFKRCRDIENWKCFQAGVKMHNC